MNQTILEENWFIVAESRQLRKKPLAVSINGIKIVAYRNDNEFVALKDTCPHRGVPLSKGQVVNGEIECCYHGWKFDSTGKLACIPGVPSSNLVGKICVKQFGIREEGGFIWVCLNAESENVPFLPRSHKDYPFRTTSRIVKAKVADILENFLDPLHTHTVHPGIIRARDSEKNKRHKCHIQIKNIHDGYEAFYKDEKQQSGIISRLFGSKIIHSIGRVRKPGIVELEYCSETGIELIVTVHVTPIDEELCRIQLTSYIRPGRIPFFFKALALAPFQLIAIRQDKTILEIQSEALKHLNHFSPTVSQNDVMAKAIKSTLNGHQTEIDKKIELFL